MPCAKSLYRKGNEDEAFPPTGLKRLIVLAIAGDVKSITRLYRCAIEPETDLGRIQRGRERVTLYTDEDEI